MANQIDDIQWLTDAIAAAPENTSLYVERGKLYFKAHDFGNALNDFHKVLSLEPEHVEVGQYVKMINEILDYRYTDIYNP